MDREPRLPPKPAGVRGALFAGLLELAGCSPSGPASDAPLSDTEWREFQGTWTAAGSFQVLRLGADRQSSIAHFDGSLMLAGPSRQGMG